jgi:hypothetical protein
MNISISSLLALLALFSPLAMAAYTGPLLTKNAASGYTLPSWRYFKKCEIYSDKIVLTDGVAGVTSVQSRSATVAGLPEIIAGASSGRITETPAPVDGPSLIYTAYKIINADQAERVDLASDSGVNGKRTLNTSDEAHALRTLADMLCK